MQSNESYFLGCLADGVLNNPRTKTRTRDGWHFVDDYLVEYLAQHPEITNYVILDDVPDFSSIGYKNVVLTNDLLGLTEQNVKEAIEILEEK